jgi:hypothetical protein
MSDLRTEFLDAALSYAARGWKVFPLHSVQAGRCSCSRGDCSNAGKHPRFRTEDLENGLLDATTDEGLITSWWREWPEANVGVATGAESGFFVLDIDPRHQGEVNLALLLTEHGALPPTVQARTGGGGDHYLFEYPGFYVKNRVGRYALEEGIEIKGDGGYIVAPPSTHLLGHYLWELSSHPEDVPILPAPEWLLDRLRETARAGPAAAIASLISEGSRDDTLTSFAGSMRRRGAEPPEIYAALRVMNDRRCVPPLADQDLQRIADSMSRYEPEEATTWRVGARTDAFTGIDPLRKISSDPPRYEATVLGEKLRLAAVELAEWRRFKFACLTRLNYIPVLPKEEGDTEKKTPAQVRWEVEFLQPAVRLMKKQNELEAAPEDAGEFGAAWQSILLFFARTRLAEHKDEIFNDRLYYADGTYYFRGRVLRKWLGANHLDRLKADELWNVVREHGGRSQSVRTKLGVVETWLVPKPAEALQDEGVS